MDREELVEIGRVAKPWGVRGEVKVQLTTDVPDRFQQLEAVWIDDGRSDPRRCRILSVKQLKGAVALKLEGIDDPTAAEPLRGASVAVPEGERAELGDDEYYIDDLVGLEVFDTSGVRVGSLSRVYQGAGHDVFEVDTADGPVLVPAVRAWIHELDPGAGRVVLTLPVLDEGEAR